jgi:hypothetical protein
MYSKLFLATKYLAMSFMYLLLCGVYHLVLWLPVTFISHKDVYSYKEKKRSCILMTLALKHYPSWMDGWMERYMVDTGIHSWIDT